MFVARGRAGDDGTTPRCVLYRQAGMDDTGTVGHDAKTKPSRPETLLCGCSAANAIVTNGQGYAVLSRAAQPHADGARLCVLGRVGQCLLRNAVQRAHVGIASGAVGYRLGIKHGLSRIMLWFPAIRLFPMGMFLLEPFSGPRCRCLGSMPWCTWTVF